MKSVSEDLQNGSIDIDAYPSRIFEHDYVTGVLGIELPLNEAAPYSDQYRQLIIEEHLLLEGFFGDVKKLTGDSKNAALALRYIMQDAGRISQYIDILMADLSESYDNVKKFLSEVLEALKEIVKEYVTPKIEKILEWTEDILKKVETLYDKVSGASGWKGAMLVSGALVGIGYLWSNFKGISKTIIEGLAKVKTIVLKKVKESYDQAKMSLVEFYEVPIKSLVLKEELSDKVKQQVDDTLKKIMSSIKDLGPGVLKGLAVDALAGALTGGIGTAFSALKKVFGGAKTVFKFLGKPLEKFVDKIKNPEKDEKEADAGKNDPTDKSTQKEAYLREYIRQLLSEEADMLGQEQVLPQDEWVLLQPGDERRELIKDDLYNMVQSTYADIGGHFKIQNPGDLDRYSYWVVKDIDDEPDADVAIMGKPDIGGVKMGAAANDGSAAASAEYKNKSSELRAGGSVDGVGNWWGEVSGKPAYAMIKRGAPAVEDEATARQLMAGDDFVWHGAHPDPAAPAMFKSVNGWYTKKFGSHKSTKIILGSPS